MALYQKGLYQKRLFFICFNSNHSAKMSTNYTTSVLRVTGSTTERYVLIKNETIQ